MTPIHLETPSGIINNNQKFSDLLDLILAIQSPARDRIGAIVPVHLLRESIAPDISLVRIDPDRLDSNLRR